MRTGATVLVVAALLAALVMSRSGDFTVQPELPPAPAEVPESETTNLVLPVLNSGTPDEDSESVRPQSATHSAINLPAGFTQSPEMHARIVEYLVSSGVAPTDAERTADSVAAGLKECAEVTFSSERRVFDERALQTCTLNVVSEHGLPIDDATIRTTFGSSQPP